MGEKTRTFDSGASRNSDEGKLCLEGFINPLVTLEYGKYMHHHRFLENGEIRSADNWQKGIPKDVVIDSAYRHFLDWHLEHRGYESREGIKDALCGLLFNVQSYLLTVLEEERANDEEAEALIKTLEEKDSLDHIAENRIGEVSGGGGSSLAPLAATAEDQRFEKPNSILQRLPWLKALSSKG